MKIGIIGFGNMGRALAEGIVSDRKFTFDDIVTVSYTHLTLPTKA